MALIFPVKVCRADIPIDDGTTSGFYFKGCYTAFTDKIESRQDPVIGLAIGIVTVMFLNILFFSGILGFLEEIAIVVC